MENIVIANVCGLCAGCKRTINLVKEAIDKYGDVTIFKEIVHNTNVNNMMCEWGAKTETELTNLKPNSQVIIRAHGEPIKTFNYLKEKGISYVDGTCPNVARIHNLVHEYSQKGYDVVIIGKHKPLTHPEVEGTIGWVTTNCFVVQDSDDVNELFSKINNKLYLVCQTTFNMAHADELIDLITNLSLKNNVELVVNKSICNAQKQINLSSVEMAKNVDVVIVVGGKKSSNSKELYNNIKTICPAIFIENVNDYKNELNNQNIVITKNTKIGLTAGASTLKEELIELKQLIQNDLNK